MVTEFDPFAGADGHMNDRGPGPAPVLDRIAARALHASGFGLGKTVQTRSEEAKDRLYRRMFPDRLLAGAISDAPISAVS